MLTEEFGGNAREDEWINLYKTKKSTKNELKVWLVSICKKSQLKLQ